MNSRDVGKTPPVFISGIKIKDFNAILLMHSIKVKDKNTWATTLLQVEPKVKRSKNRPTLSANIKV